MHRFSVAYQLDFVVPLYARKAFRKSEVTMGNNSGIGWVIVFILAIVLMFGGCVATCTGSSHSSHYATDKEKETAQYMGTHGYFNR